MGDIKQLRFDNFIESVPTEYKDFVRDLDYDIKALLLNEIKYRIAEQ